MSVKEKIVSAGKEYQALSIRQRCELLGLNRSSYYYEPQPEDKYNQLLMNLIDEEYTKHPFYGSPKLWAHLRRMGHNVNIKRIKRLMHVMGIRAIYPTMNTSKPAIGHKIFPYLLSGHRNRSSKSGMERRYYIYSNGLRIYVFSCDHRLVQSVCSILEIEQYNGYDVLLGRIAGSSPIRQSGNF